MPSIVWGPSGASVPGHARTGLKRGRILATIWIPGANPFNVVRGARGKSLWLWSTASRAISPGPRRCHDGDRSAPLLIFRFDHHSVAVDHRNMAVPGGEVAGLRLA